MTFEQAAEIIDLLNTLGAGVTAVVQLLALMLGVLLFVVVQSAFKL